MLKCENRQLNNTKQTKNIQIAFKIKARKFNENCDDHITIVDVCLCARKTNEWRMKNVETLDFYYAAFLIAVCVCACALNNAAIEQRHTRTYANTNINWMKFSFFW